MVLWVPLLRSALPHFLAFLALSTTHTLRLNFTLYHMGCWINGIQARCGCIAKSYGSLHASMKCTLAPFKLVRGEFFCTDWLEVCRLSSYDLHLKSTPLPNIFTKKSPISNKLFALQRSEHPLAKESKLHLSEDGKGFVQVPISSTKELFGINFQDINEAQTFYGKVVGAMSKLVSSCVYRIAVYRIASSSSSPRPPRSDLSWLSGPANAV